MTAKPQVDTPQAPAPEAANVNPEPAEQDPPAPEPELLCTICGLRACWTR